MTKLEQLLALGFTRAEILATLLGEEAPQPPVQPVADTTPAYLVDFVGKFCIVRATQDGVHAGTVRSIVPAVGGKSAVVVLEPGSRRLWRWRTAKSLSLSAVAEYGLSVDDWSRCPRSVGARVVIDACGIDICTAQAQASIEAASAERA